RPVERGIAHSDDRNAMQVVETGLYQIESKHIRYEIDRRRRVVQSVEHRDDARPAPHGQRDVDLLDVVAADVGRKLLRAAEYGSRAAGLETIGLAILEIADHACSQQLVRTQGPLHLRS